MAASEAAVEGISGAVGAMIACVATYPLMTISTKQAVLRNGVLTKDDSKTRRGTLSEITSILRNQGLQGLYHGIQPALIGTGVSQGVYFYLYGLLRKFAVVSTVQIQE